MRAQNEMMEFKIRALANLFQGVNDHYLTGAKTLSHELERLKTLLLPLQKTLEAVKVIDEFDMPLPLDQFLPLDEILGDRVALRKGKGKTGETDEHLRQVAFPNQTRAPKSWLSEYLKNQQVLVREEGLDRNIENERQIDKTISINEKMLSGMTTEKEEKMTEKGADRQEAIHQLKVLLQKIPIGGEISTSEGILSKVITERGNSVEEIMQKLPELIDEKMLSGMVTEKEKKIMEKGADRQEAIHKVLLQKIPIGGEISISEGISSKVVTERGTSVEEIMQKLPELIDEKMLSGMATEKEEKIMEKGADRQEAISRLKEIIADARHKRSSVGEELLDKMVQKVSLAVEEVKSNEDRSLNGVFLKEEQKRVIDKLKGMLEEVQTVKSLNLTSVSTGTLSKVLETAASAVEYAQKVDSVRRKFTSPNYQTEEITPFSFEAMLSSGIKTQFSKNIQGQAVNRELLERITKETDSQVKMKSSQQPSGIYKTEKETKVPEQYLLTVSAQKKEDILDSISFPSVYLDTLVEQWWRENREVLKEQKLVSRLKEEMVPVSSNSKSGQETTTRQASPQVNNTFNIQVYPEEFRNRQEMNTLAERINKILIDQARRYGIEVR